MTTQAPTATQVYRVFIKATPEAVWDAITKPEWSRRYGYGGDVAYDLRPGGEYKAFSSEEMRKYGAPEVVIDGEVIEADPPRRLVQTWRMLMTPETAEEGFSRLTYEIEAGDESERGATKLTVTHELENTPLIARTLAGDEPNAGGGWPYVLSDIKSLLETGEPIGAA